MEEIKTPSFVFYGGVADKLRKIEDEQARNDFAWRVIKYGCFHERDYTNDGFKDGWLDDIFQSIDRA